MALAGTPAIFYLSSLGEQALGIWFGKKSSFPALMVSSDSVGAWILHAGEVEGGSGVEPVILLKWDYLATVTLEMGAEDTPDRAPIGFHIRPVE